MSYRNKTYVIFDGDTDMWAYAYMKGWKENERVDFNFYDAHDLRPLTDRASEETVKAALRQRMANAKQVVVLVGEQTKNLYRFVQWEIDLALGKNLPIVVVNLNGKRSWDPGRCPAVLTDAYAVHVDFKMRIIKHALDDFPEEYLRQGSSASGPREYDNRTYQDLGL